MFLSFIPKHHRIIALLPSPLYSSTQSISSSNLSPIVYLHSSSNQSSIFPIFSPISQTKSSKTQLFLIDFKTIQNRPGKKMRPKSHPILNLKFLLLGIFTAFFLLFVLRSNFPTSMQSESPISQTFIPKVTKAVNCSTCTKIPPSLAQALIHYSTSTITPQQTQKEISVSARVLEKKSPCNFLVFGLGHDSLMWNTLNYGGRTIFLEEDESWIQQIRRRFPMLESYHVTYDSKVNQANNLMDVGRGPECTALSDPRYSMCQLALKGLPSEVYETKWDLIMVDAPTGYYEEAPGRMTAIYTAGMMARNREDGETDVFVHDVNREVEDKFSKAFLCEGYMKKQVGRLRHFTIPSHRDDLEKPFCPQ